MTRILLAIFLMIHGVIHTLGFVVPWKLASVAAMPYTTKLLNGTLEVGPTGARVVGVLWLITGLGFVAVMVGLWLAQSWWQPLLFAVSLLSLILCVLGWPASFAGVLINLALLLYLFAMSRVSWVPQP